MSWRENEIPRHGKMFCNDGQAADNCFASIWWQFVRAKTVTMTCSIDSSPWTLNISCQMGGNFILNSCLEEVKHWNISFIKWKVIVRSCYGLRCFAAILYQRDLPRGSMFIAIWTVSIRAFSSLFVFHAWIFLCKIFELFSPLLSEQFWTGLW